MDLKEAKLKAASYCAYQERAPLEVKNKMSRLGLDPQQIEQVIEFLMGENFLNPMRYAESFSRGKFRLKKWGRRKISFALKQKQIPSEVIEKALMEIGEDDYQTSLKKIIQKKYKQLNRENSIETKHKIARHLLQKGYESDLIWRWINILIKPQVG